MLDPKKFRRYYNDTMHAELSMYERKRKKLLIGMLILLIFLVTFTVFIWSLDVFVLSIATLLPWIMFYYFFKQQAQKYKDVFKPLVVRSLLQFIDPRLRYYHNEYISKDSFLRSGVFPINPEIYNGEDYIRGKIGEVAFEMCELDIYHTSKVKVRLEKWFDGIFFHANFNIDFKGRVVIIPRDKWQSFIPVIKSFTKYGGYELEDTGVPDFDRAFFIYVDRDIDYHEVLTRDFVNALHGYFKRNSEPLYASFYNSHFYLFLSEPRDFLQAKVFQTNNNFELIEEYYRELSLFFKIVEDFDIAH